MSLLERLHAPDLTLSASRRRADFIRPQETTMEPYVPPGMHPDETRVITLYRFRERWSAHLAGRPSMGSSTPTGAESVANAGGPGEALEYIGQRLDAQEAERLTRVARGETALTVEEAVEREQRDDVARIVGILEYEQRRATSDEPIALATTVIAVASGITALASTPHSGKMRALRALRRAQSDGVIVELETGDIWRLATDDELEARS